MSADEDLVVREDTEEEVRTQVLDALQAMVDWLRTNPQVPVPYGMGGACFLEEDEGRAGREGTFGWTKNDAGNYIQYSKTWGPYGRVSYSIYVDKSTSSTCRLVKVGTKHVEAVPEHEEDDMKWVCTPTEEEK